MTNSIQFCKQSIDQIAMSKNKKEDKFDHITEEEIQKVDKMIQEKWNWLENSKKVLNQTPQMEQPTVFANQIKSEQQVNIKICIHTMCILKKKTNINFLFNF